MTITQRPLSMSLVSFLCPFPPFLPSPGIYAGLLIISSSHSSTPSRTTVTDANAAAFPFSPFFWVVFSYVFLSSLLLFFVFFKAAAAAFSASNSANKASSAALATACRSKNETNGADPVVESFRLAALVALARFNTSTTSLYPSSSANFTGAHPNMVPRFGSAPSCNRNLTPFNIAAGASVPARPAIKTL